MKMQTLTPAMLHELIDKIEFHHITGTGKSRVQQIVIHYRFVGCIEIPDAPQVKHPLDTRHLPSNHGIKEKGAENLLTNNKIFEN